MLKAGPLIAQPNPVTPPASGASNQARPLLVPTQGRPGFTLVAAADAGIRFTNRLSTRLASQNQILLNGSGVAAGDYDGDGKCDLYFCTLTEGNHLYRNLGHWRFQETTASAGVGCPGQFSTGTAFADLDGDTDLDLLVNSMGGGTRCFLNDGRGRFLEATNSGLQRTLGSHSLALADVDQDGDLDLYVANYRTTTVRDNPIKVRLRQVDGRFVVPPPYEDRFLVHVPAPGRGSLIELGEPDAFYRNVGGGNFQVVSWDSGVFLDEQGLALTKPPRDWGLSVLFRDLNNDGAPDLYVCNDFASPDRIWFNDGHGRLRAAAPAAFRHTSWASMAVDAADIDRDGHDDLFVADMLSPNHRLRQTQRGNAQPSVQPEDQANDRPQYSRNTLFWNRGDGTYAEIADQAGVEASDWTWGSVFLDVDLDGYEDLLVANGHGFDMQDADAVERLASLRTLQPPPPAHELLTNYPALLTPNRAYRNRRQGSFEDAGDLWHFNRPGITHGVILADLDEDGDLDVVTSDLNQAPGLYRNESSAARVAVRLTGQASNTRGIGARIRLVTRSLVQSQVMIAGGRYLSADDTLRSFAANWPAQEEAVLEVRWPRGSVSTVKGVRPNHLYEIAEAAASPAPPPAPAASPTALFAAHPAAPGHPHRDDACAEANVQPLLPRSLARGGPAVAWQDINRDGWEDWIVAGGKGGALAVFTNTHQGNFRSWPVPAPLTALPGDQTAIIGFASGTDAACLLIAQSGYESTPPAGSKIVALHFTNGTAHLSTVIENLPASLGPLALADLDADGDLDLFAGGQFIPGRFPEPAPSFLFRNQQGAFVPDNFGADWRRVGLVNAAIFADLNNDGQPDLVLACDWGPIRVFFNAQGRLLERTTELGLDRYRGFWNGVSVADLDEDGMVEIIASNWGRNHLWQRYLTQPLRLYFAQPGPAGSLIPTVPIEAVRLPDRSDYVPFRDLGSFRAGAPSLVSRFRHHAEFARITVDDLLGDSRSAPFLEVDTLDHCVFTLRTNRVVATPLPPQAQMSAGFGVAVGDFDADGHEDVFLTQNIAGFGHDPARLDSGRGLWLRGDGRGGLVPMESAASGVLIHGEQRGAALADFDHDGRVDLLLGQHNGECRLYRNHAAQAGLRVRCVGPVHNRDALGASVRLRYAQGTGPVRQVVSPSGYASQSASTLVLGTASRPQTLLVRWPDGRTEEVAVPPEAKEIVVERRP